MSSIQLTEITQSTDDRVLPNGYLGALAVWSLLLLALSLTLMTVAYV